MRLLANRYSVASAILISFFGLWEAITQALQTPSYILPSPSNIFEKYAQVSGDVWSDAFITIFEASLGLLLAIAFSVIASVVFLRSKAIREGTYPLLIALKCTPLIAIAPLLILWIGYGVMSKIVMAAIVSFFPIVVNLTTGLNQAPETQVALFRSYRSSWIKELFHLRAPYALPYFFASLRVAAPLSVVGAIVAEFMGASEGVGFAILMASYNADTPLLFVYIFASAIIGVTLFSVVIAIENLLESRRPFQLNDSKRMVK